MRPKAEYDETGPLKDRVDIVIQRSKETIEELDVARIPRVGSLVVLSFWLKNEVAPCPGPWR